MRPEAQPPETVRDIGAATEDEAVLAFLQGEIDSPRFAQFLDPIPLEIKHIIRNPTLGDPVQDYNRRIALNSYRGYLVGDRLFAGWPRDLVWRRVAYDVAEVGNLLYAKHPSWMTLTAGTRRVVDGARIVGRVEEITDLEARKVVSEIQGNVEAVIALVQADERFPPLIAVTDGQRTVLVEGHTRATAYLRAQAPSVVEILLGTSPSLATWAFY